MYDVLEEQETNFTLIVNSIPQLEQPIGSLDVLIDKFYSFQIPDNTFIDLENEKRRREMEEIFKTKNAKYFSIE